MEGEKATFECELSKPNKKSHWLREGKEITVPSDKYETSCDGPKHTLTVLNATLQDAAKYAIVVDEQEAAAKLTVEGKRVFRCHG